MRGACHCGAVRFQCQGPLPQSCRLCQCSYCRKAGARWWSDPAATLVLQGAPAAYRFGTRTADFLFCPRCGVLVAAYCEIDGRGYAVLNVANVEGLDAAALPWKAFSFDGEDEGARLARRRRNWMSCTRHSPSF